MANEKKIEKAVSKKKKALKQKEDIKKEKNSNDMTAQVISTPTKNFKVKLPIRIAVIVFSVIALSWFFEGCRQIKESITLSHVAMLLTGLLFTVTLLWLQALWIYLEEKYKGTLRRKNGHFERVEEYWNARKELK